MPWYSVDIVRIADGISCSTAKAERLIPDDVESLNHQMGDRTASEQLPSLLRIETVRRCAGRREGGVLSHASEQLAHPLYSRRR